MKITFDEKQYGAAFLNRAAMRISAKDAADGFAGVTKFTAVESDGVLTLSSYLGSADVSVTDNTVTISVGAGANFFSLASDGDGRLNGKKFCPMCGALPYPVVFSDKNWAVIAKADAKYDFTEDGAVKITFAGDVDFTVLHGYVGEQLELYSGIAGDKHVRAISEYAVGASDGVNHLPCDAAAVNAHPYLFGCFSEFARIPADGSAKSAHYTKLRYNLIPYIYSAVIESKITGMPLVRPLVMAYRDSGSAEAKNEYMFGRDFLVTAGGKVWLPEGESWMNLDTYRYYAGGQLIDSEIAQDRDGVVFVRGGAVVPMSHSDSEIKLSGKLRLLEVPGGQGGFRFYESDGKAGHIDEINKVYTHFTPYQDDQGLIINFADRSGELSWLDEGRSWFLELIPMPHYVGIYVDVHDVDWYVREDGFAVADCGDCFIINTRFTRA